MKTNRKKWLSLLLVTVMLLSLTPTVAYAAGESVRCTFPSNAEGTAVTVYDASGAEASRGADGVYLLVPGGSYTLNAEAAGYEPIKGFAFSVPAEAVSDQELQLTLTPAGSGTTLITGEQKPVGGIFAAKYSKYQVFEVQRDPKYPTGTQKTPNAFTVRELAAPAELQDLGEEDYFFFVGLGPASETGVAVSDKWNSVTEGLDPYTVELHAMVGGTELNLGGGVIGAFSNQGFLFVTNGRGFWVSNNVGYRYASTSISYTPVENGRLVCDLSMLTNCAPSSMLEPDPNAPAHVHHWVTTNEGSEATFRCTADGCPCGTNVVYTATLDIAPFIMVNRRAQARLVKSVKDADWPEDLQQNIISYVGRGDTKYSESINPPTELGSYTAKVTVGYRKDVRVLEADFAIVEEEPVRFEQTQSAGGVVVTVKAEAGVLPADAKLTVTALTEDEAKAAVEAARVKTDKPVASYGVDISLKDKDGKDVVPADGHSMSESLMLADAPDANLTTLAYRVTKDGAAVLGMSEDGGCTVEETESALRYVAELSYPALHYSLKGNESVALDGILEAVGLSGAAAKVEVQDPQVLYAYEKNGAWQLRALRGFTEEQSVKVTVRNLVYEIAVEDGDLNKACQKGHRWSGDNGTDPVYCLNCGELKAIAEGGSFELEFDNDRWIVLGDAKADTENYVDWEKMFDGMELTGNWATDLLAVAATQLDYTESSANYAMNARRERNGYTRYGAWYGIPYGEWCAMFVSFCLHYAGIEDAEFPYNSGCEAWVEKLSAAGLYAPAAGAYPKAGDLIFYDEDGDGMADHVGIVNGYDANSGVIYSIEGNLDNRVQKREIGCYDWRILGYGLLPMGRDLRVEKTLSAEAGEQTVTVSGLLPADAELMVAAVPAETAAAIYEKQTGEKVDASQCLFAYDVYIKSGESKYDLAAFGESITVSVSNVASAEESLDVLHLKVDVTDEAGVLDETKLNSLTTEEVENELLSASSADGAVTFGLNGK